MTLPEREDGKRYLVEFDHGRQHRQFSSHKGATQFLTRTRARPWAIFFWENGKRGHESGWRQVEAAQ